MVEAACLGKLVGSCTEPDTPWQALISEVQLQEGLAACQRQYVGMTTKR